MKSLFLSTLNDVKLIHSSIEDRFDAREIRSTSLPTKFIKTAFDTRRTNQEIDYNPRRNLQNYHRSDPFISKDASEKIKTFFKLKVAVDEIKDDFLREPEWNDSYTRVLSSTLDKALRIGQNDMDFFQPHLDYLDELLYLRYRLKQEDINKIGEKELKEIILAKDEKLLYKNIYANYKMKKDSKKEVNDDNLMEKLFGNVKASKDNKNVERTVKITINDKILEKDERDKD
jgi:hypothetical protein